MYGAREWGGGGGGGMWGGGGGIGGREFIAGHYLIKNTYLAKF